LKEVEAQKLMHKVTIGLRDLSKLEIVHRDLHLSNIVLHFPSLEPTEEEMDDIYTYMDTLSKRRHEILNKLGDDDFDDFQVKFIDFGLSKLLEPDLVLATPVGVLEIIPPEMERARTRKVKYDSRVDVWNCGLIFYMMLFRKLMFRNQVDATTPNGKVKYKMYEKNMWTVGLGPGSPEISI
jgi:serine/threonine protein kinase